MRILSAKIKHKQREYFFDITEITDDNEPDSEFNFDNIEIKEAMENLDPQSRLILSLSVLGGYTSEEISKICDINANTVRSKISRIKKHLKTELS